jgi:hypothetical protein
MEMTLERAKAFLVAHQPMAADVALSKEELGELDAVRRFLVQHPHDEALGLLLGTFGEGSGFGVYQLIEEAAAAHEPAVVVSILADKLRNGLRSVRYWCALISANYPNDDLVPPLAAMLTGDDVELRSAVVTALSAMNSTAARAALQAWLPLETDDDLREVIEESIT